MLNIIMIFSDYKEEASMISLAGLGQLVFYLVPSMLSIAIPMSILTGVLLGVGRLTVDSEVKALRTHGVSLYSVFIPVIFVGLLATGFVLFNSLYFAPRMLRQSVSLVDEFRERIFEALEPGRFERRLSTDTSDITLYFSDKDRKLSLLKNVCLWYQGGLPEAGKAKKPAQKQTANKIRLGRAAATSAKHADAKTTAPALPPPMDTTTDAPAKGGPLKPQRIPMSGANIGERSLYTVEFWAKTTAKGKQMAAVGIGNRTDNNSSWIFCGMNEQGGVQFNHIGENSGVTVSLPAALINDGSWHYVACVRGLAGAWEVYRDGKLAGSATKAVGLTFLDRAKVGALPRKSDAFEWKGDLGWVRISKKARSAAEIAEAWKNGPDKPLAKDPFTLWTHLTTTEQAGTPKAATPEDKSMDTGKTLFLASSGSVASNRQKRSFLLTLTSGTMHVLGGTNKEGYSTICFGRMSNEMPWSEDGGMSAKDKRTAQASTLAEINTAIGECRKKGSDSAKRQELRLVAQKYQRMSISLACLGFVLIGLPLAIYIRPSGKSVGISIAFSLIAVYYLLMHFGVTMTEKGTGSGPFMIFLPNILLIVLGVALLHRTVHR